MSKLGEFLGGFVGGQKEDNQALSHEKVGVAKLVAPFEKVRVVNENLIVEIRSIAGNTMIWGHSTFGIWGSNNWGNTANTSFILGHSLSGVLGTAKLGSQSSDYVEVVRRRWTWRTQEELEGGTGE